MEQNEKIRRISIVDQVCAAIKEKIAEKIWVTGKKLPSEAEIAAMFAVNRLSVRMALQKLSTLGILETRVGIGTFVKEFSFSDLVDEISDFYLTEERLSEIQQLRHFIELDSIRSAQACSQEEKDDLFACVTQYSKAVLSFKESQFDESAIQEAVNTDLQFHMQVVKMSHNSVYLDVYYMMSKQIRCHIEALFRHRFSMEDLCEQTITAHQAIYDGICSGDVQAVQQVYKEIIGVDV